LLDISQFSFNIKCIAGAKNSIAGCLGLGGGVEGTARSGCRLRRHGGEGVASYAVEEGIEDTADHSSI